MECRRISAPFQSSRHQQWSEEALGPWSQVGRGQGTLPKYRLHQVPARVNGDSH